MRLPMIRLIAERKHIKRQELGKRRLPAGSREETVYPMRVEVGGNWLRVFVPGIDDPDDTGVYIP